MRIHGRVIGAIDPAAASGSTPARMTSAAWRNSISTAWTSDRTIAISAEDQHDGRGGAAAEVQQPGSAAG